MAAKKNGNPLTLNPAFDGRMQFIGNPNQPKLRRGFLIHAPLKDSTGRRGLINFLYNPTTITVTHNIDPAQIDDSGQPEDMKDVDKKGNFVGIGTVNFDLLFDRTFELWDGSKKNTLAGKLGVYADVLAFYHFLGLTSPVSKDENESGILGILGGLLGHKDQNTFAASYPIAPARPTLCYVYIGKNLKYYGQISGLSIQYTHWNHDMIPARAAISFGLQLQSDGSKATTKIGDGALYTSGATSGDPKADPEDYNPDSGGSFSPIEGD